MNLLDEASHDSENARHGRDRANEQRSAAEAFDEEPRDEGGRKEPGKEDTRHESCGMVVETDSFAEDGATIVDDSVDSSELLEELHTAGDEKSATAMDVVFGEKRPPAVDLSAVLEDDGRVNPIGKFPDIFLGLPEVESSHDALGVLVAFVSHQPPRRLGYDQGKKGDGDDEHALHDDRNTPCVAICFAGEGIPNPITEEDAKIQS